MKNTVRAKNTVREPLFHISQQQGLPFWKSALIHLAAVLIGMIICAAIISSGANGKGNGFFGVFASLFSGIFGSERRIWLYLQDASLLLCVSIGLVVAFRMKFWNLGGNGQVLMGCLACTMCMYYMGGKLPDGVVYLFMFLSALLAGAVWALIPALFKVFFNTNESLFTLMMNYIAYYLVAFFISFWYPTGTGAMGPLAVANLPSLGPGQMGKSLLSIIIAVLITVIMTIYLKYSKHGYEISIVGESRNTAKYAGISVKKVIIRTMILSGAICGIVGFLLSGSINHMVSVDMDGNMGFTGIMVAWLGKFSPLFMVITSLFISFLTRGMSQVCSDFGFTNTVLTDIIVGIFYFLIIACEFFINYKINFNDSVKNSKSHQFFKRLFSKKSKKNNKKEAK